jgi:DNA-binding SARP family transcriptional activator
VVSANALIDTLWDTGPPASARASLLNHVSRLRASLGEAGRYRLRTEPGGYLLTLFPGELDVSRFEKQLTEAQNAARNSEWRRSSEQAKMALAQWRGQPLSDVTSLALSQREVPRLEEMQLQTLELKLDADLHLRGHAAAIPQLRRLVQAYPLRENLRVLLMLALYRSDRQAEALTAYREARDLLVHELGTEPGASLRDLHQRILAGDPSLTAERSPAVKLAVSLPPDDDRMPGVATPGTLPGPIRRS